jgi:rod shape-determining protein MreD
MRSIIKYVFISLLLIIVQSQAMKLLSLEGMTPDILAIWVVYIALRQGQMSGTIWGFVIGLLFDLVTGNFIGLSALTKTACGFIAGYFYNENKTMLLLSSYRFTLVILMVSFLQNIVYFIIFTQGSDIGLLRAIFEFGLATSLYTATLSLLPVFFFSRKLAH